jgi:hypothetical protein
MQWEKKIITHAVIVELITILLNNQIFPIQNLIAINALTVSIALAAMFLIYTS